MAHDNYAREYTTMFPQIARGSRGDVHVPNADVYVAPDQSHVLVQVELAGIDRESLTIAADDQSLFIAGRRSPRSAQPSGNCLLKEIEYGNFERSVHLPFAIDHERVSGTYEDGILTIELPAQKADVPTIIRTEIRLILRRATS